VWLLTEFVLQWHLLNPAEGLCCKFYQPGVIRPQRDHIPHAREPLHTGSRNGELGHPSVPRHVETSPAKMSLAEIKERMEV